MIPHEQMQRYVDQINQEFQVGALWNGYGIRMLKKNNLVIGGSQDWIYFHNIDVIFKKVIFYNLPSQWQDTAVVGNDLFRLSDQHEFELSHPDFDVENRHVFAFDMHIEQNREMEKHTFFIVASNVFFDKPEPVGDGFIDYDDPLGDVGFWCKKNRVFQDS
jgi:hypothetical protein